MSAASDLQSLRDRWYREDSVDYDRMAAAQERYLAALDTPLLAICRGRVLELACGTGRFLAKLGARPAVTEAIGVDLAPQMLRAARGRGFGPILQAEAERLPLTAASVDSVVCTFYSLRDMDRSKVYAEVARVLRPGGPFGFTLRSYYVSYVETLWRQFIRRGRWPHSLRTLDGVDGVPHDVRNIRDEIGPLEQAGLRVREIKTLQCLPFVRRFLPYRYWSGAGATRFGSDIILIAER